MEGEEREEVHTDLDKKKKMRGRIFEIRGDGALWVHFPKGMSLAAVGHDGEDGKTDINVI